jgi:hypothetical protein
VDREKQYKIPALPVVHRVKIINSHKMEEIQVNKDLFRKRMKRRRLQICLKNKTAILSLNKKLNLSTSLKLQVCTPFCLIDFYFIELKKD